MVDVLAEILDCTILEICSLFKVSVVERVKGFVHMILKIAALAFVVFVLVRAKITDIEI